MTRLLIPVSISAAAFLLTVNTPVFAGDDASGDPQPAQEQIRFFESVIRPLLVNHCCDCHGEETQEGKLRLDTLQGMIDGGNAGPAFSAGKPQRSLIVTAVSYRDSELRMPPDGKLTAREIADLTRWIEMGAPHPDRGEVTLSRPRSTVDLDAGRRHWAFQPLVKPELPAAGVHPIDAFIRAELDRQGLSPLGRADRRTLIRRATFDLLGLPPTREEIDDFVADDSEDAFSHLIERLLKSPHYGERWGRHWLDVARYADSNGRDENAAHGNAWRYRDYVVQSFNTDRPYDRFLVEQLAGDLLDSAGETDETRQQRLIATGYLVLGPKVLAEVDEDKMEMDIVDEQIDTIGRGLMGLTLGCVRCHAHKFDPFEHADYYALAGIFKSTRTMETFTKLARWNEVFVATDEDRAKKRHHEQLVAAKQQRIDDRIATATRMLESPVDQAEPDDVEQQFSEEVRNELQTLRDELKQLEESVPQMPAAMAVSEGSVADAAVHVRGSHLTLGDTIPRRFPRVLAGDDQAGFPDDHSGRLEFARWLTSKDHPLTARVMVNRIWRWHFGKGLVSTVDNFGMQGTPPTHPALLDWLAVWFIEEGWSIKQMHRLILSSETYQMQSSKRDRGNRTSQTPDATSTIPNAKDPGNRYYWRFDVRRLEAEAIRDTLLAVSGELDRTIGGSLLTTPNRKLVFNHTSQDASNYTSRRRSIYLPVIRNHLYDMFQLFDYTDASVLNGNRATSTIAPQALFLMNSEFITEVAAAMAERFAGAEPTRQQSITRLFEESYGRLPTEAEIQRVSEFLTQFESRQTGAAQHHAWQALCQSIISSSEFVYVR